MEDKRSCDLSADTDIILNKNVSTGYSINSKNKGLKYDGGKLRWDLLPLDIIEEAVKVYTFGAKKYKPNSWQNVENGKERYYAALMRHLKEYRDGKVIDEESGLMHLAHALWNVISLIYFEKNKEDKKVTLTNKHDKYETFVVEGEFPTQIKRKCNENTK